MTIWWSSDLHLGHANIIKYSNRPFKTVEEMNEQIITRHNFLVKPNDTWYCLGDFGMGSEQELRNYVRRLNGKKELILGNHDKAKNFFGVFDWVGPYKELKIPDPDKKKGHQLICMFHYSCRVWNASHHGSWQLYGHSHHTLYDDPNLLSIDVGVDGKGYNYSPISYEQVKELMKKKTFKPIDHHGKDRD